MKNHLNQDDKEQASEHKRNDWKKELEKFDGDDKINYMKEKARILEEEALRKEQYMKFDQQSTTENRNEVNDLIIDSIKAKIALLDNIDE